VTPLRSIGRRINDLGSTAACNRFTAELRDERIEVRSLTLKLQDFKVRAKERVDRGEEELRSAEARHSRELEKLRRKMRQEKQDEIGQMMEKVCALILLPAIQHWHTAPKQMAESMLTLQMVCV
jgi:molecular chaperone GrpE (heat shock protein)